MTPRWTSAPLAASLNASDVAGACPASAHDRLAFFIASPDGLLRGLELDTGHTFFSLQLPFTFSSAGASLAATADGRYVAIGQADGLEGALIDVSAARILNPLARADYHANVSSWGLCFVRHEGVDVLVFATEWNVLEAWTVPALTRLVPGESAGPNYFYGPLFPSPSGDFIVSSGWVWHPVGILRRLDVKRWLAAPTAAPPFEDVKVMRDWWNDDVHWLSDELLAFSGEPPQADDDDHPFSDRPTHTLVYSFATHRVVRVEDGALPLALADTPQPPPPGPVNWWHPGAKTFVALGAPLRAHWKQGTLEPLPGGTAPDAPTAENLVVLADALEGQGGAPEAVTHCRDGQPHGTRCWVLEGLR